MSSFVELSELAHIRLKPELDALHQQLKYLALSGPTPEAKEDYIIRNVELRAKIHTLEHVIELFTTQPTPPDQQA